MTATIHLFILSILVSLVSANGIIFGLSSTKVSTGEHYAVNQINNSAELNDFLSQFYNEMPERIVVFDLSSVDDSILSDKMSFKSIIQSSSSSFVIPHNQVDLSKFASSLPVLHQSIQSIEDIRSAFNALDQETNNHVLVLFQMKSSNLSIESPLSTKTASDSGKYLTPEIFLALCILFIFIVGVLVAYQMTDAVQTPTQWVEKPLNVGKLY